jgi:FMN phosphatase YigB (HAD superfamily)
MKTLLFDLDDTLFDTTNQLGESYENLDRITPFEGIHEVLTIANTEKNLITAGNPEIQRKKIEILNIGQYFKEIIVCEQAVQKLGVFETFANTLPFHKRRIIVIGNRIDCEILYGNQCGFVTVLINHGKYAELKPSRKEEVASHTVSNLVELLPILTRL